MRINSMEEGEWEQKKEEEREIAIPVRENNTTNWIEN